MRLSEIQDEVIGHAHSEGSVAPPAFARLLSHDPADVDAAISDLVDRGLMVGEGDSFRLTEQGEAEYRRQAKAERAATGSRVRTWQPR